MSAPSSTPPITNPQVLALLRQKARKRAVLIVVAILFCRPRHGATGHCNLRPRLSGRV